jgi:hypothetical protein
MLPLSAGASHTQPPCGAEKWLTKNVSPPDQLADDGDEERLHLAEEAGVRVELSFTSIARLLERATMLPASAITTSLGASASCSIENDGANFTWC